MAKMWAAVNAEAQPINERRSDVPPALDEVMRRAMSKSPDERPSAAEFRRRVLAAVGEPA
jgi:hypothetical protein